MDFDLDEELLELQSVVRRLCAERLSPRLGRVGANDRAFDRRGWEALASIGLLAPEDLGEVAACVAFEELGRALVTGPVVATAAAAAVLDGAGAESRVVTTVRGAPGVHLVEHLDVADDLLRVDRDGVFTSPCGELEARRVGALDPMATASRVEVPVGTKVGDAARSEGIIRWTTLLSSALLVGSSSKSTELAVSHASERVQFGRPVGSFQAVKHLLADSFARTEVARAALHAAAVSSEDGGMSGDPARALAGAHVLAIDAGIRNAQTAVQVFGGMGFTWEVEAHLHLKRCWALSATSGSISAAASAVVARVVATS